MMLDEVRNLSPREYFAPELLTAKITHGVVFEEICDIFQIESRYGRNQRMKMNLPRFFVLAWRKVSPNPPTKILKE